MQGPAPAIPDCLTAQQVVVLETSLGDITVGLQPGVTDLAERAAAGQFGATIVHRINPQKWIELGTTYPNGATKDVLAGPADPGDDIVQGSAQTMPDGALRIHLDGAGSCTAASTVGHVTSGLSVARDIARSTPSAFDDDGTFTPVRPVLIHRAHDGVIEPARMEVGAVTPKVHVRDNATVVLWSHNAGDLLGEATWDVSLPRGWTIDWDPEVRLLPIGFRDWAPNNAGRLDIAYPDWTYTTATVAAPAGATDANLDFALGQARVTVRAVIVAEGQQATTGDQLGIDYVGTFKDGSQFGEGTFQVTLGDGRLFPAMENALVGVGVGDELSVQLPAALAYGFDITANELQHFRGKDLTYSLTVKSIE